MDLEALYAEVATAYADCGDRPFEETRLIRQLDFRASQAADPKTVCAILKKVIRGGYNNFEAKLVKLFPDDCQITIAREGSVCLYVKRGEKPLPTRNKLKADEYSQQGDETRIWWD